MMGGGSLAEIKHRRSAVFLAVILLISLSRAEAQDPVRPRGSESPVFSADMTRLALKDYLLYLSPRQERAWLNLDKSVPGVLRYEGGVLPKLTGLHPGMYTFSTQFRVVRELAGTPLALNAGIAEYPHRVYLNGVELLARGRYAQDQYNSSIRTVASVYLSPDLLNYGELPNTLVYEAYPSYENWALDRLYVGTVERIAADVFLRNLLGVVLVQATFILSLLLCAYFAALFLVSNREDLIYLQYALICLAFCASFYNVFVYHEGIPELPLEILSKGSMVILSTFMVAFCVEFSGVLVPRGSLKRRLFFVLIFGTGILGSGLILIQPDKQAMLSVFSRVMGVTVIPHLLLNVSMLGYSFFVRKNRLAIPVFLGFVGIGSAAFHDMAYLSNMLLPYTWMTPYGYVLFICLVFALLVIEQSRRHTEAVRRSDELRLSQESIVRLNEVLENTVAKRTAELQKANEALATLAGTDALTGIANRRRFDEVLALEWRRAERDGRELSLAMLDVDFFKLYNDEYGHLEGDRVLRRIAEVLASYARRPGDLAARYGGEEFVLVLPGLSKDEAGKVALAVINEVRALGLPHAGGIGRVVTISAGVAAVQVRADLDLGQDSLVREADKALYQAKAAGRDALRFAEEV